MMLVALTAPAVQAASVQGQSGEPTFAIDAGISGNSPTNVDRIEDCVEVQVGDRFQMDVVVQDITDLLAWELPLDYQPGILQIVGQDVKLFQQANEGSSVIDLSNKLPNDSGFHELKAFDSADPPAPDSGTGVLARITLEALAQGESPVRFGKRDADNDGTLDRATLIRNVDAEIVGDVNDDTFFDGEQTDALVVVDGSCPSGSVVAEASTVSDPPAQNDDGDSAPWLAIAAGVGAGVVALLGLALLLTRRRRRPARA